MASAEILKMLRLKFMYSFGLSNDFSLLRVDNVQLLDEEIYKNLNVVV